MASDGRDANDRVRRGIEEHRYERDKYGGRGFPRGPLNTEEIGPPAAIGFCAFCAANARETTAVRGLFDCPECFNIWFDRRVGMQPTSLDDFFSDS